MKNSIKDYLEISKIFIKYHLRFKDIIFIIANWAFSKIISLPFILLIYISLPINRKMYLFFRKINLYVQLRVNYFVKSDLAQIESNLENILKIEKNRKKIATLSLFNKELQNDLYNELF